MTYSLDLRRLALSKLAQGQTFRQIAQEFGVSIFTLQNWKKNPMPKGYPKDRKPLKITREALLKDVEQYPDAYQYERAQRLGCAQSAIHNALKRYGITRKKDQPAPQEANLEIRKQFLRKEHRFYSRNQTNTIGALLNGKFLSICLFDSTINRTVFGG